MTRYAHSSAFVALALALVAAPAVAEFDQPRLVQALKAAGAWEYGQNPGELNHISQVVVAAAKDRTDAPKIEKLILTALGQAKTLAGKDFLCRQLVFIGSEAAVPALAKLLTDPATSHIARYALARLPGTAADQALIDALPKAPVAQRVGLAASLGDRRVAAAVGALKGLLTAEDLDLVRAAYYALGRIGTEDAVAAIAAARPKAPKAAKVAATDAYLIGAATLKKAGKTDKALAIYRELYAKSEASMTRIAALKGLAELESGGAMKLAIAALADQDPKVRQAAIPTLRDAEGQAVTRSIAAELARQPAEVQLQLLLVLVDRADTAALPEVLKLTASPLDLLRATALEALGTLGDASVVGVLAKQAAKGKGVVQQAARGSLDRLKAKGVDAALARALSDKDAEVRVEVLRALGARRASEAAEAVLKATSDKDPDVRAEAYKALRTVASAQHVPAMVDVLVEIADDRQRAEMERAVLAAAQRGAADTAPARAVLSAYAKGPSDKVKASLVRVLGKLADPVALATLTQAAKSGEGDVKADAIRALGAWPAGEPSGTLEAIAKDPLAGNVQRILALRGYIELIAKQTRATDKEVLAMYKTALRIARRMEEKQLVLSRLSLLRHEGALAIAKDCLAEPGLRGAAQQAIKKIEKNLAAPAHVTASVNARNAKNAVDGKDNTRWDTGAAMKGGEWFAVDLGRTQLIRGLTMDNRGSGSDHPRGYEIWVSRNMLSDGKKVAEGKGTRGVTKVKFAKGVLGRRIKIVQTGKAQGNFWSIHKLTIDAKPAP